MPEEPKKEEPKKEEPEAEEKKEDEQMKEAPKEPEPPKELEVDAVTDKRPKLAAGAVEFGTVDSTLNVMTTAGGKLMMALADDGMQYFMACSRANTGIKSGRHMIEYKILEICNPMDKGYVKLSGQKQLCRVGFSTASSSLYLSDSADAISFDSEGFFTADKKKTRLPTKFMKGATVAVLLNLDAASPNADTISIFVNGKRACDPQKLPESLKGKALYPTVNYRNVTLQVNFGPTPFAPLPFTCAMLAGAAKADSVTSSAVEPKVGEVLFPVSLPGQGSLDWVDDFIEKNPTYLELSDRKIIEWASKSGVQQPKIEDFSVGKLIQAVAPIFKRNYIVVDLKSNLIPATRANSLKLFSGFKKVASVLMGEPSAEYKEKVKSLLLAAKTRKAEAEFKRKKAEVERKKMAAERVKKAEAAKKARIEAAKKKTNGEEAKEEEKVEEKEEEEKPVEEEEIKMDAVELSEDELKLWYRPSNISEIPAAVLSKAFTKFALPEKSEGFDDVKYLWQPDAKCAAILKDYVLEKKMTVRVEDLKPGEWFVSQIKEYTSMLSTWKTRQNNWKNPALKKNILAEKAAKSKKEDGEEKKEGKEKKEEEPAEPMKIDAQDMNPMEVKDIMDIGSGEPLFINFAYEDWAMVSLRTEMHLLVHAFKKDMNDPERTGFHESHAGYYFNKYMKKQLEVKHYGKSSMADLVKLLPEVVTINSQGIFEALLPEDTALSQFVKLAEENRRDRQRRVDAGDETAELKIGKPGPQQPQGRPPYQQAQKRPYQGGPQFTPVNKKPKIGAYQPVGGFRR